MEKAQNLQKIADKTDLDAEDRSRFVQREAKAFALNTLYSVQSDGEADQCSYIKRAWPELNDKNFELFTTIAESLLLPIYENMTLDKVI